MTTTTLSSGAAEFPDVLLPSYDETVRIMRWRLDQLGGDWNALAAAVRKLGSVDIDPGYVPTFLRRVNVGLYGTAANMRGLREWALLVSGAVPEGEPPEPELPGDPALRARLRALYTTGRDAGRWENLREFGTALYDAGMAALPAGRGFSSVKSAADQVESFVSGASGSDREEALAVGCELLKAKLAGSTIAIPVTQIALPPAPELPPNTTAVLAALADLTAAVRDLTAQVHEVKRLQAGTCKAAAATASILRTVHFGQAAEPHVNGTEDA